MRTFVRVLCCMTIAFAFWSNAASAQTDHNLATCLSGKYPSLCRHEQLSPEQLDAARRAELIQNYAKCLDGRYPALCRHEDLTADQAAAVDEAERRANYATCIQGKYLALCDHRRLTPMQRIEVDRAEREENLRVCLQGRYIALCRHQDLTPDQANAVREAEHQENRRVCASSYGQFTCRKDWLAQDAQQAANAAAALRAAQPTAESTQLAPQQHTTPPLAAVAKSPKAPRCASFWVGAVDRQGNYIYLSDYTKLVPVQVADKPKLATWQRGQDVELCDGTLTNKGTAQSVTVSE
ncbi:hypothetical protein [Ralstonia sp. ASV6]|uniref:hypothetical protein n=1 Tax=Ralstonia sp. ASV6 TaxID=2795124 RepID=UPI0018EAC6B1|nr:hypothetical protein [Ralstonia sp. ASV6]